MAPHPDPHAERPAKGPGARLAPSLSQLLLDIAADDSRQRISVGDLLKSMQDRAMGALIFVFAIPNAIPLPPGASSILGAPLLFLTAQLAFGRSPWLPKVIAARSMDRSHFAAVVQRIAPWLGRAERLLRPRLEMLALPPFENIIGVICLLLSIILFLPIPFGNMPPAVAICLFALGILERDGVWVIGGGLATIAAISIVWGVLLALFKSGLYLLARMFGQ